MRGVSLSGSLIVRQRCGINYLVGRNSSRPQEEAGVCRRVALQVFAREEGWEF